DDRVDSPQRDRRDRQRHLGLRGASQRKRGRHQPAVALDRDPDHGAHHGRDLLSRRPRQGLRRRQRLRVHVRRAGDPDHRRGGLADESAGDQIRWANSEWRVANSFPSSYYSQFAIRYSRSPPHRNLTMPKMTGAQLLADMLQGYGVTHAFMVPAVLRRTFVEMERRTSIKRIHTHGEKSAAYMADGYARASGRPGVCMAQVIGALNLAAGLR